MKPFVANIYPEVTSKLITRLVEETQTSERSHYIIEDFNPGMECRKKDENDQLTISFLNM